MKKVYLIKYCVFIYKVTKTPQKECRAGFSL